MAWSYIKSLFTAKIEKGVSCFSPQSIVFVDYGGVYFVENVGHCSERTVSVILQ